ncbi:MAG: hypothetical protein ACRD21_01250 [Vicinamibacteria bacterium]
MGALYFLAALTLMGAELPPLAAGPGDPVFTTYAAPLARSQYRVDEARIIEVSIPEGEGGWAKLDLRLKLSPP